MKLKQREKLRYDLYSIRAKLQIEVIKKVYDIKFKSENGLGELKKDYLNKITNQKFKGIDEANLIEKKNKKILLESEEDLLKQQIQLISRFLDSSSRFLIRRQIQLNEFKIVHLLNRHTKEEVTIFKRYKKISKKLRREINLCKKRK